MDIVNRNLRFLRSKEGLTQREFAERLRDETGVPAVYWDERLTTVEAERVLREAR